MSDTEDATPNKFVKIGLAAKNDLDSDVDEFDHSVLAQNLQALSTIYDEIAQKQQDFSDSVRRKGLVVACPTGCGLCCQHFIPDVLPVEADFLSYYLILRRPTLINRIGDCLAVAENYDGCPFWEENGNGKNCLVYEARPLICRLFAFSAVHSKKGETSFAFCKKFETDPKLHARTFTGEAEILDAFGALPPVMSDYASMVLGIDPDAASERLPLDKALPSSLNRVALILQMTARPA